MRKELFKRISISILIMLAMFLGLFFSLTHKNNDSKLELITSQEEEKQPGEITNESENNSNNLNLQQKNEKLELDKKNTSLILKKEESIKKPTPNVEHDSTSSNSNSEQNKPIIPEQQPIEKPIDVPNEKPQPNPVEKPTEKPVEKPIEKPTEKPIEKPIIKPVETPSIKPVDKPTQQPTSNFMDKVEEEIFNIVNKERVNAGLAPLSYNNTMEKYARIKSKDMGDNNYFSHEDLNGNLITTQMKNDGVSYKAWGENIAWISGALNATEIASKFMNNWMNSSGHRANILSTNFDSIGIGVYKIGNKIYATQEFFK